MVVGLADHMLRGPAGATGGGETKKALGRAPFGRQGGQQGLTLPAVISVDGAAPERQRHRA